MTVTLTKGVRTAVKRGRPLSNQVIGSSRDAARDVRMSIVDAGDPKATAVIHEALGVPVRSPAPDDIVLLVLTAYSTLEPLVEMLQERRRNGGEVIIVIAAEHAYRRVLADEVAAHPDLGIGVVVPLADLGFDSLEKLRRTVVRRLGDDAVAAARQSAPLAQTVTRERVRKSAVRAAVIGGFSPGRARMPVLTALQVRMMADVSNVSGSQPQTHQAAQVAGAAIAAPVFRQVARGLSALLPGAAPAVRASIAGIATYAMGVATVHIRRSTIQSEASREER